MLWLNILGALLAGRGGGGKSSSSSESNSIGSMVIPSGLVVAVKGFAAFPTRPKALIDCCVVGIVAVPSAPLSTLLNGLDVLADGAAVGSSSTGSSEAGSRCFLGLGAVLNNGAGEGISPGTRPGRFVFVGVISPCVTPVP